MRLTDLVRRIFTPPATRWAMAGVVFASLAGGALLLRGFDATLEATNSLGFCISCHEMRSTVYEEYKGTIHHTNATGVRAVCADCHVPHDWTAKVIRKAYATRELYHHFAGTIDTQEKFEANRAEMAERVWAIMEANDSRECRSCHVEEAIDFHAQADQEAAQRMEAGLAEGQTCISCHKGIAHKMPDLSSGYLATFDALEREAEQGVPEGPAQSLTTKDIFLSSEAVGEGGAAGRLLPATALTVEERKGDAVRVSLEGWQQEGAERVIYAQMGQRILSAALRPEAIEALRVHETTVDPETELTWRRVSLDFWTGADGLIDDRAALWEYGRQMYEASCSTCHALHSPRQFLANQWIGNLKAMERFITLDDERQRFLLKYLQFHARDAEAEADGNEG